MKKELIEELKRMNITTTQTSKTFYYIPEGGWKRGVEYSTLESIVLNKISALISRNVSIKSSPNRYLEFNFIATNNDGTDFSTEIVESIEIMFKVCSNHNLELINAG